MFQIIKDGEIIAIVESPRFISKSENGSFVQTDEENAKGIAVNGVPYNLSWNQEPMEGTEGTVTYSEINGGEYLLQQQSSLDAVVLTMLEVLK